MNNNDEIFGSLKLISLSEPIIGLGELNLNYLGKGSDNLVYEITNAKTPKVLKISTYAANKILRYNYKNSQPLDLLEGDFKIRVEDYINIETERYEQAIKYFGTDYLLNQSYHLISVPIDKDFFDAIKKYSFDDIKVFPENMMAVVTIQDKCDFLIDTSCLSMIAGYAEKTKDLKKELYDSLTQKLLTFDKSFDPEYFFNIHTDKDLENIVKNLENPQFKTVFKDFITKTINYSNETKEILDLAASYNLFFYNINNWSCLLLDAIYPSNIGENANLIDISKSTFLKIINNKDFDEEEQNILLNSINYARVINFFAILLDLDIFINIIPDEIDIRQVDFLENLLKEIKY
jgi:hypothetical protein